MACHAVGIAANSYLQRDQAICLWLLPSNAIREQTLTALKDRQHPYRQALDAKSKGQVRAIDLTEALYIQRGAMAGGNRCDCIHLAGLTRGGHRRAESL